MDSEILVYLKDFSLEVLIISALIFLLTMLIKWPIKRATSKLEENRRKMINTVIVFIPILLSAALNALSFWIFKRDWKVSTFFDSVISCYVLALVIYAFYSRIVVIIKGIKKPKQTEQDFGQETIEVVKQNVKSLSKFLKVDESKLQEITKKLSKALALKTRLLEEQSFKDIAKVEELDKTISNLEKEKTELLGSITSVCEKLETSNAMLNIKGE